MKTYQLSIPSGIKKTAKMWVSLFCLTGFLVMGSVSSVNAQACPSIYTVQPSGNGIRITGSDIGVYYQLYRNGYAWDVYQEGTGDFMYWDDLCSGHYTVVAWKDGCPPLTLTNYIGQPVTINNTSCFVFSADVPTNEVNLETTLFHSHEVNFNTKTDYAWFIDTNNTSNWLSKNL